MPGKKGEDRTMKAGGDAFTSVSRRSATGPGLKAIDVPFENAVLSLYSVTWPRILKTGDGDRSPE